MRASSNSLIAASPFCRTLLSGAECKAVCTEAGMFALRERRIHVTQEDFDMAVAKVSSMLHEIGWMIMVQSILGSLRVCA